MTSPTLAIGVRGRGRHYPWPPVDPASLKLNQWGSVNPADIPDGVTMLPSVTNILDLMDKPALRYWYAEHAIRSLYGSGVIPLDCDEAVSRHKSAANKVRDNRATDGTDAHDLMEQYARGEDPEVPDHLAGFWEAGCSWWDVYEPEPVYIEATVAHPGVGYAGTGDLFAYIGGDLTVIDYKTRAGEPDDKKIDKYGLAYESNRLQLAALAHATRRIWCDDDGPGSEPITRFPLAGMVVCLFENGEYRIETLGSHGLAAGFSAFCGLVTAWNWKTGAAA